MEELDWSIRPLTLPEAEPLTLAQAKAHLRIPQDVTDFDDLVEPFIPAARDYLERSYDIRIVRQTCELGVAQFPRSDKIYLPIWPVQSVDYFHYLTADQQALTIDLNSRVKSRVHRKPAVIVLRFGQVWPAVIVDTAEGLQIGLTVGWETDDSPDLMPRPAQVDQAMKLLIGHMFANGSAVTLGTLDKSDPLVLGVDALMNNIRLR